MIINLVALCLVNLKFVRSIDKAVLRFSQIGIKCS